MSEQPTDPSRPAAAPSSEPTVSTGATDVNAADGNASPANSAEANTTGPNAAGVDGAAPAHDGAQGKERKRKGKAAKGAETSAENKAEAATAATPADEAEADAGGYRVSLPSFEGPLDLLLHLIQKHELNILDIPIGFIAQKYVEYLRAMEELSIDVASEYLVMAATLTYIKSRSLLPPDPSAAEDELTEEEETDPRAELIRRLLEYQKYKQAAEELGGRAVLGRDVFVRGVPLETSSEPAPLAPMSLFKLVDAFEEVLKRSKRVEEHQVDFERISISDKIGTINELLRERGSLRFEELFDSDKTRAEMIVTFLALLEMTKLRMVFLKQEDALGPITVELRVREQDDEDFSWTRETSETEAYERGASPPLEEDALAVEADLGAEPDDVELQDAAWATEDEPEPALDRDWTDADVMQDRDLEPELGIPFDAPDHPFAADLPAPLAAHAGVELPEATHEIGAPDSQAADSGALISHAPDSDAPDSDDAEFGGLVLDDPVPSEPAAHHSDEEQNT